MADKGEKDQRPDKNENSHEPTPNSNESLESFITEQYAQQKVNYCVGNCIISVGKYFLVIDFRDILGLAGTYFKLPMIQPKKAS